MLHASIILPSAVVLLAALLTFEKEERLWGRLLTKTPLSVLFIVAALAQYRHLPRFSTPVIIGLFLCLGGDVLLALRGKNMFRLGLVSFLAGHICYIIGFTRLSGFNGPAAGSAIGIAVVGLLVYRWLAPGLGTLKGPVIAYIVVISGMVCSAVSVVTDPSLSDTTGAMIFSGATLFYLSDIFVARQRFISPGFANRLFGLPMYYAGQFLIAFSVGMVR